MALQCAFLRPDMVGKAGAQSLYCFEAALEIPPPSANVGKLLTYLDWGKYDLRNPHEHWDVARFCRNLDREMRLKGHSMLGGEVHDGTGWSSWKHQTDDHSVI